MSTNAPSPSAGRYQQLINGEPLPLPWWREGWRSRPCSPSANADWVKFHRSSAVGFVYVIRNGGLIKIGRTNDVARRMRELKPDEILSVSETDDSAKLEKQLHAKFRSQRLPQSEYFRITPEEALGALGESRSSLNRSRLLSINPGDKDYVTPLERVKREFVALSLTMLILAAVLGGAFLIYKIAFWIIF